MKKFILLFCILLFLFTKDASAIYDPLSLKNNKVGIHILFPEELSEASAMVNSNGGDWGYVTIPIQAGDRNIDKWQKFMNECRKYHLIPLVRLSTAGDYFNKISWSKPTNYDVLDFANFLNSLNWPTQNRYIIVFNETNRGDEWGGEPNVKEYAEILSYSVDIFKEKSKDFFIIAGGLDNASSNIPGQSVDDFSYLSQMNEAVPGIFSKIDGLSSHSYPNPGFSMPPTANREGVNSFLYQKELVAELSGKNLPIFITETGWSSDKISLDTQASYYKETFQKYWNDNSIVAVTPFVLLSGGPFSQFSFIKDGKKTQIYNALQELPKVKGEPKLTKPQKEDRLDQSDLPTEKFDYKDSVKSLLNIINGSSKTFFKWLLKT
jgi:hypothetical protein